MSGHTPGPWTATAAGVAARLERGANVICEAPIHYSESVKRWEANAALIAAAPDLLEALRWYATMSKRMGDAAIAQDSQAMLTLMKELATDYGGRAKKAIAKAEGGDG